MEASYQQYSDEMNKLDMGDVPTALREQINELIDTLNVIVGVTRNIRNYSVSKGMSIEDLESSLACIEMDITYLQGAFVKWQRSLSGYPPVIEKSLTGSPDTEITQQIQSHHQSITFGSD